MDSNLTQDSALGSTQHDQERREERDIQKITQLEARRYGMAEKQKKGRIKFTYAGHVFIWNSKANKAITSWKENQDESKVKKHVSGTRFVKPIMIDKSQNHTPAEMILAHECLAGHIRSQKTLWRSHTVMVIDMSGSMRRDDVDGARCRSDGVWTSLAKDFVKSQLESGTCSLYDIVSVVAMREDATVVIDREPMDWVLYNKLVDFREVRDQAGCMFFRPKCRWSSNC